jgi:U2-associated protein SR140
MFFLTILNQNTPFQGYNSVYSTDSGEESERERCKKNALGKLARKRFEAMLRALSGKRGEIARCMAFCLEHAEAAHEVCAELGYLHRARVLNNEQVSDIIVASLLVDSTAVPRKVARLHLICDILHNSAASVPSAWKFRQEFQARLGIVFDHLANIYHSFPGRITADTFKKQITAVVDIWEDWIVFPPDFTSELRARLDGSTNVQTMPQMQESAIEVQVTVPAFSSRFKSSSFHPMAEATATSNTDDNADSDVDGAPLDDVDGEPLNDDIDGVPIDDIDGAPIKDDVDGVPMDDVDGVPMDDVDGVPIDNGDDGPDSKV